MGTYSEKDFGVVIDGQFHSIDWMPHLVNALSKKVMTNIIDQIEKHLANNPLAVRHGERNFTIDEIASMTNRSVSTVTRHCRIGLLKASKVGKAWLITEKNYSDYKNNVYDANQIIRS